MCATFTLVLVKIKVIELFQVFSNYKNILTREAEVLEEYRRRYVQYQYILYFDFYTGDV